MDAIRTEIAAQSDPAHSHSEAPSGR